MADGTVHVMEEEMRAAEQGVFEPKSGEFGMAKAERREARKSEEPPANKMASAPSNKDSGSKLISKASMTTKSANNPTAKKRAKK